MIQRLRKKIFWSIELSAVGVLFFILAVYNGLQLAQSEQEEWQMLSIVMDRVEDPGLWTAVMESDGKFGAEKERRRGGKGTAEIIRNLVADEIGIVESEGEENTVIVSGFLKEYEETDRDALIARILSRGEERGTSSGIKYMLRTSEARTWVVLLNAGYIDGDVLQMAGLSLLGLLLAGALFAVIAYRLAVSIAKPVEETISSQKQFIADASHELKTPVTVISANISVLEKEVGPNRWLDYIKEQGKRMTELVGSLLQLSRLDYEEDEQSRTQRIPFDLSEAVVEAALPFESIAYEQGIRYDIQATDRVMTMGNPDDTKQIVGILLDNAMKHTPSGETVTVRVDEQQHRKLRTLRAACIRVKNTGTGIPEEALPYIFNRFYKLDSARTYEKDSFGLGLAIARSLTERNGGTISVCSEENATEFLVVFS